MNLALDQRALPRKPQQQRALDRFELVLEASSALLARTGLGGFSIPAVAQKLDFNRASIYKFFPTPYAILNELARRHFVGLEHELAGEAAQLRDLPWQDVVRAVVRHAAAYHNAHPVGMMLVLGGAVTDESYRSYALTVKHLGSLARLLLAARGLEVPAAPVDVASLAVDLGTTCMRQSYALHKTITPAYQDAAAQVMIGYIASQLPQVQP